MAGLEAFDRELTLATANISPENIGKELARFAKAELAKAIAAGASPQYDRFVNGVEGAPEESVVPPGPIVYVFSNWPQVIKAALAELVKRSPRRSGRFASSFIVIVEGRAVVSDFSKIKPGAEIIITNTMPTVRKAEVGQLGIPAQRLFAGAARSMNAKFREAFRFEARFLNIRSGLHPAIPYKLKRSSRRSAAGRPIEYPSIIINVA